jgi:hypothetical protein
LSYQGSKGLEFESLRVYRKINKIKRKLAALKPISHRGNLYGPRPEEENNPDYIKIALSLLPVEIDCWKLEGKYYLGHDDPKFEVGRDFLLQKNLLLHAKNSEILREFANTPTVEVFWHENDNFTITSKQRIIYHSRHDLDNSKDVSSRVIFVKLNLTPPVISSASNISILTDYPLGKSNK